MARLYKIVTGQPITVEELRRAGERICDLVRGFNKREGVAEDTLPSMFSKSPIKLYDREMVVGKESFQKMLEEYYSLRGWR